MASNSYLITNKWLFCLLLLIAPFLAGAQAVGPWSNTGPVQFPVNVSGQVHGMGRVSQLKFHPSNPAKIYAVSASGGLFISTDTGSTWVVTPGTEVFATTSCSAVCIDYTNDNILYLSTGDVNYYGDSYGIYKSINGGVTFTAANAGIGNRMAVEILMDPTDHNTLVAATHDGIWKTTNGGASWALRLGPGDFRSMQKKPGSNVILYATTDSFFYRSPDFGSTWSKITTGISIPASNEGIRIAVTPADTNLVILGTTGGYGVIIKSTNGGNSFSTVYSSTTQCLVCYDSTVTSGSQGYYNFNITVNPANANELLLVSHCVWRSTDGGATWSWRTRWWREVHTDMHDIQFDPYNLNLRFNANDGGVWLSRDSTVNVWETRSQGLAATEMYHAAQSPVNRQLASAGTQDNGELYFDGIWKCNRGGDWGPRCNMDYLSTGTVYYDGGGRRDLSPLSGDYSYNAPFTTVPAFAIEFMPSQPFKAFLSTDSIWRSDNINNASPSWTFLTTLGEDIRGLSCSWADNNILYAVTNNGHLLRSDNALAASPSFTTLTTPGATNVAASVATDKYNANIVYLSCGSSIYRSINKGVSWTNISSTLPSLNIRKVIADQYSATERLFVCMGSYVYYKDNTTTTWTLTTGLPTVAGISDMMIYNDSTSASILRLSTYGRGMWECNILNNLPPTGSFTSNKQKICAGDTVRYYKTTYGNLTSFHWSFPGGVPATSTADSPVIVYPTDGIYNATLNLVGTYGNDTISRYGYIIVSKGNALPVAEGFEGTSWPPLLWTLSTQSAVNWQPTNTAGGYGASGNCIVFDNFSNDAGGRHDRIITPKLDLSFAYDIWLKFDVAYAYYPGYRDSLLVDISTDCGKTYATIYAKDTGALATRSDTTDVFTPTATQWRTDSISLNAYAGNSVMVAFDNVGHYGQKLYIDNVNIRFKLPPVIINDQNNGYSRPEIKVFPNPATDRITVNVTNAVGDKLSVSCYSILGQLVAGRVEKVTNGEMNAVLDLAHLPRGLYEVVVQDVSGQRYVTKIILK